MYEWSTFSIFTGLVFLVLALALSTAFSICAIASFTAPLYLCGANKITLFPKLFNC